MFQLQPVRGTHDLLPDEMRRYRHVVDTARAAAECFGYLEVETPIFEFSEVFKRTLGDTIRVSLSADPAEEVKVGFEMLKSLNLRHRGVNLISCPSCARQNFDVIKTVEALEKRIAHITTPMTVSIIGCVVNGPGEARETDIGFTGGGNNTHMVYLAGQQHHRLKDQDIVEHMAELIEKKAAEIEAAKVANEGAEKPAASSAA